MSSTNLSWNFRDWESVHSVSESIHVKSPNVVKIVWAQKKEDKGDNKEEVNCMKNNFALAMPTITTTKKMASCADYLDRLSVSRMSRGGCDR